jgi:hypothetical protein
MAPAPRRWVVLETATDGQIVGTWGPYASYRLARVSCNLLREAIDADDVGTETDATVVPLRGHRELLTEIEVMS